MPFIPHTAADTEAMLARIGVNDIDELLSKETLLKQGLFNPDTVIHIVRKHHAMREDNTDIILGLLTFQLWYKQNWGF